MTALSPRVDARCRPLDPYAAEVLHRFAGTETRLRFGFGHAGTGCERYGSWGCVRLEGERFVLYPRFHSRWPRDLREYNFEHLVAISFSNREHGGAIYVHPSFHTYDDPRCMCLSANFGRVLSVSEQAFFPAQTLDPSSGRVLVVTSEVVEGKRRVLERIPVAEFPGFPVGMVDRTAVEAALFSLWAEHPSRAGTPVEYMYVHPNGWRLQRTLSVR